MVHTDERITPDMAPDRVAQINQISQWMENDLLQILEGTGYAATRVEDPATAAGPGRYVVRIAITDYNAGSKAARMLVGFGAGAAVLRTHFELFGPESAGPLLAGDPDVGSGRDWRNAARKVNLQTTDAVNVRIAQGQVPGATPVVQAGNAPTPPPATSEPIAAPAAPLAQPAQ